MDDSIEPYMASAAILQYMVKGQIQEIGLSPRGGLVSKSLTLLF